MADRNADSLDASVLRFLIVHRSRMRMIDLQRVLSNLPDEKDWASRYPVGKVRTTLDHRFSLLMQVAIEAILQRNEVRQLLESKRREFQLDFEEVLRDALYLPSDRWLSQDKLRIDEKAIREHLETLHRNSQFLQEATDTNQAASASNPAVQEFRFAGEIQLIEELLNDVANWLREPTKLIKQLESEESMWIPVEVLQAIPRQALLERNEWRFTPNGTREDRDTKPDLDQLQGCKVSIMLADQFLRSRSDQQVTLQRLSDEFAILSTSPAWNQVSEALTRIQPFQDSVDPVDSAIVLEYVEMLELRAGSDEGHSLIQPCLEAGTVLGMVSGGKEHPLAVGLKALSDGFAFSEHSAEHIERRMNDITERLGFEPVGVTRPRVNLLSSKWWNALGERLDEPNIPSVEDFQAAAWRQWEMRYSANIEGRTENIQTSFDELLCRAADVQPARMFLSDNWRLDFRPGDRKVDLNLWSRALFAAFAGRSLETAEYCPFWLIAIAMYQLGFGEFVASIAAQIESIADPSKKRKSRGSFAESDQSHQFLQTDLGPIVVELAETDERFFESLQAISNWSRVFQERIAMSGKPRVPVLVLPNSLDSDLEGQVLPEANATIFLPSLPSKEQLLVVSLLLRQASEASTPLLLVEIDDHNADPDHRAVIDAMPGEVDLCYIYKGSKSLASKRVGRSDGSLIGRRSSLADMLPEARRAVQRFRENEEALDRFKRFVDRFGEFPRRAIKAGNQVREVYVDAIDAFTKFRKVGSGELKYWWDKTHPVAELERERGVKFHRMAIDYQGRFILLTDQKDSVRVLNNKGMLLYSWGRNFLRKPTGICVDEDNQLFVADAEESRVFEFHVDGELLRKFGRKGTGKTSFQQINKLRRSLNGPTDVTVSLNGRVFVTDGYRNGCVQVFSRRKGRTSSNAKFFGGPGKGDGRFMLPMSIAVDREHRVYVADRENNRVQVFSEQFSFMSEWTDLRRPSSVLIDGEYVYVAELGDSDEGGRISIFDTRGNLRAQWGGRSRFRRRMCFFPFDLAIDHRRNLFVISVDVDVDQRETIEKVLNPEFNPAESDETTLHFFQRQNT